MPEHFECTTLAKKALYKYSSFPFPLQPRDPHGPMIITDKKLLVTATCTNPVQAADADDVVNLPLLRPHQRLRFTDARHDVRQAATQLVDAATHFQQRVGLDGLRAVQRRNYEPLTTENTPTRKTSGQSNLTKGHIIAAHGPQFLYLKVALSHWEPGPCVIHDSSGAIQVHFPNSILISSAVFAGLTIMTDRRTDRRTDRPSYSVCNNRPHLRMQYCGAA